MTCISAIFGFAQKRRQNEASHCCVGSFAPAETFPFLGAICSHFFSAKRFLKGIPLREAQY